jgi:molecular chaperone DnaK
MVKDAEAHADEDRKFHELVTARNQADALIHGTEKSLKDLGDKVEADEKAKIESAIAALQEAIKGEDKDDIEAKTTALSEVAGKLAERAYAENAEAGADAGQADNAKAGDDVVDAEFEEVDDDNKK